MVQNPLQPFIDNPRMPRATIIDERVWPQVPIPIPRPPMPSAAVPIPRPRPQMPAPLPLPRPSPAAASAVPMLPGGGGGSSGKGGLREFLGSDEVLALAAGLMSNRPPGEALGIGFQNALQARMLNRRKEGAATTDDMREYAMAKAQGYQGSFMDFMKEIRSAGAMQIKNMGNIPPGYSVEYDDAGNPVRMVPIPGGPEDTTQQDEMAADAKTRTSNIVRDEVGRALSIIDNNPSGTTGWGGAVFGWLPASEANSVKVKLETIKANIGFDKLQEMRQMSKTGAALGPVSDFENRLLQATFGSLEQSQKADDLRYNLRRIDGLYSTISGANGLTEEAKQISTIGKMVDAGQLSEEQGRAAVDKIMGGPVGGAYTLQDGTQMREVR